MAFVGIDSEFNIHHVHFQKNTNVPCRAKTRYNPNCFKYELCKGFCRFQL